ncbi:MAG: TerC family protein [Deltaproteobacteria bacterium]|nr:TerC family protein [Deltaproteobacteria bacterium]
MQLAGIGSPALWIGFGVFVIAMLALDLGVFHRNAHEVRFKEALGWSLVWIALSLVFNGLIWWQFGSRPAVEFLTAYLIEKSLSVDNIFVFVVIFASLGIPALHQHRVLFWGILSALILRAAMIFAGVAMLERFHWLIYVFGAFLVFTGFKLFRERAGSGDLTKSWSMKLVRRVIPSSERLHGGKFFVRSGARLLATPLLVALVLVELSDVVFALDSIPAVFAVTRDPFLVFTSNIFAILGLRSLFFLLAGMVDKFSRLKLGLASVLVFVGAKMALVDLVKIPAVLSLCVIALLLGGSVVVSIVEARRREKAGQGVVGPQPALPGSSRA